MKADKAADPPPFSSMKPRIRFGVPPVLMRTTQIACSRSFAPTMAAALGHRARANGSDARNDEVPRGGDVALACVELAAPLMAPDRRYATFSAAALRPLQPLHRRRSQVRAPAVQRAAARALRRVRRLPSSACVAPLRDDAPFPRGFDRLRQPPADPVVSVACAALLELREVVRRAAPLVVRLDEAMRRLRDDCAERAALQSLRRSRPASHARAAAVLHHAATAAN